METNYLKMILGNNRLLLLLLLLLVGTLFTSTIITNWDFVFDDAFISFRYAQNLANGHGIVWNVGEAPVEGYTNLLLILVLAPFIAVGIDPLLVTRLLSFASLAGIVYVIYKESMTQEDTDKTTAIMIASIILLYPASSELPLMGLESIIYTFFLLISFIVGNDFIQDQSTKSSIKFSLILFATSLIRPEVLMLYPILFLTYLLYRRKSRLPKIRPLIIGTSVIVTLAVLYLSWKIVYFGDIFPNPFYVKASHKSFFSNIGLDSVFVFVATYNVLVVLSLFSLITRSVNIGIDTTARSSQIFIFGLIFILLNLLFFSHTDTLMDIYGRFLYPLIPILIYINIPLLTKIIRFVTRQTQKYILLVPIAFLAFALFISPLNVIYLPQKYKIAKTLKVIRYPKGALMHVEQYVGKTLATFPGIQKVKIAFGDSGMIPYYSQAIWLDLVGLNDRFIAKNKDLTKILDYYFEWSPDLLILGGLRNHQWGKGHGPLGDFMKWIGDPRFDQYKYVGTTFSNDAYNLHFFTKEPETKNGALHDFVKEKIIDGNYEVFPMVFGSHSYKLNISPRWVPRKK